MGVEIVWLGGEGAQDVNLTDQEKQVLNVLIKLGGPAFVGQIADFNLKFNRHKETAIALDDLEMKGLALFDEWTCQWSLAPGAMVRLLIMEAKKK